MRPVLAAAVLGLSSILGCPLPATATTAIGFEGGVPAVQAQQAAGVPPVVRFTGTLPTVEGQVVAAFALYSEAAGGEPLWSETQVVTADANGRYTVLLGATQERGLPHELFVAGAPRWVGVRLDGQAELPRVLLPSVPYALKAGDAETVGGRPLSAFVLAGETTGVGADGLTYVNPKTLGGALGGAFAPTATAGSANFIGKFTSATELGNSALYDASGNIGLGTTGPAANLHVVGTTAPAAFFEVVGALGALPAVYRAARGTPAAPAALQTDDIIGGLAVRGYDGTGFSQGRGQVMFRAAQNWTPAAHGTYLSMTTTPLNTTNWVERLRIDPAGNVGIGTATPAQKLSVAGVVESTTGGFKFPDGTTQATASSGGTSYSAGAGLSLGSYVFSVNFGGTGSTAIAARSDHNHAATYATLSHAHDYLPLAGGTLTGNLGLPATASTGAAGVITLGGVRFLHAGGATTVPNTFVGSQAGSFSTSGYGANVGIGAEALRSITTGESSTAVGARTLAAGNGNANSAFGFGALQYNATNGNSAFGYQALGANTVGTGTAFGTTALWRNTTGLFNTAVGFQAIAANLTGSQNSALGYNALGLGTGNDNSGFGYSVLYSNTASGNSAFGSEALHSNTTGANNNAFGYHALAGNTTGGSNTAFGTEALAAVTTHLLNTAVGYRALALADAAMNTAVGAGALDADTTGNRNSAFGHDALGQNVTGYANNAFGESALFLTGDGDRNSAFGNSSLFSNVSGSSNTAFGDGSLIESTGSGNTGVGREAGFNLQAGSFNTFVGYYSGTTAGTTLTNATAIGASATVTQDDSLVLGNANVSVGIGTTAPNTKLQVVGNIRVGTSGTNGCVQRFDGTAIAGTCSSDARLKTDIQPLDAVLDRVTRLEPVYFRWRAEEFPKRHFGSVLNIGLIAQDVEKVFPELVSTDEEGYKLVSSSELPYLTIAALGELEAKVVRLEAQNVRLAATLAARDSDIAALKARLETLVERLTRLEK